MNITITMFPGALLAISRAQAQALAMTAQQILNETRNDQVIPFDTGNTQNESTYVDDSMLAQGKVKIVTDNPYARRIYYSPIAFKKMKNMNARSEWWEEWLTGGKAERAKTLFEHFFRTAAGGYVQ